MKDKILIDYNIYLEEGSLERKLGDVVYDSCLLSSIMPPGAKQPYKIVKIIVTMEYEQ